MMFGMFLGKVPVYGLLIVYAAPIILSPFALFFQVSLLGQIIMYLTIFFVAIGTLFLSTLITTAIQAKLGESSRGNDIAKALAMVVAVIVLVPMYGLMYFAESLSAILGMDVFLIFPFTWGADIISWSVIIFNGIGIPFTAFASILKLNAISDFALFVTFTGFIVFLAYISADRILTFGAGPRIEKITTVGEENFIIKSIRRISPGAFGVLIVTSIKEFTRKMQNVSRLLYGVALSVLLPVILSYSIGSVPEEIPPDLNALFMMLMIIFMGMMLAMITGVTFGGIGFLESKDQLWIMKSAPHGVSKFAKARILESFILAIPIAIVPSITVTIVFGFNILEALVMLAYTYLSTCGAVLLSTGITANNPAYEDQRSSAFYINTFASIFLIMLVILFSFFIGNQVMMIIPSLPLFMLAMSAPLIIVGTIVYMIGIGRMSRADIN